MERDVLCGANSYEEKYYFNEKFKNLPAAVQDEIHVMCVLYTEACGGVLTVEFEEDGTLLLCADADEADYMYDEIDAKFQLRALQEEKKELFGSLELYYRTFFCNPEVPEKMKEKDESDEDSERDETD